MFSSATLKTAVVPQSSFFGSTSNCTPFDLRDLVGHDRRPVSFLVYLWVAAEQARRGSAVQISYQELAQNIGVSKSSVQVAVSWLRRRNLLSANKETSLPSSTTLRSPH